MHPIEHLRAVARSGDHLGPDEMVGAAAHALAAFADDPAGLVAAARRLVARNPTVGPLWWLCSRVLVAGAPAAEARRAVADLEADPTVPALAGALPEDATVLVVGWPSTVVPALARRGDVEVLAADDGTTTDIGRLLSRVDVEVVDVDLPGLGAAAATADLVVLEAWAAGPAGALAAPGSRAAAAVARDAGHPVWLVLPVGRVLPGPTFAAARDAAVGRDAPWAAGVDLVPAGLVDVAVGTDGPVAPAEALARSTAPLAPELLRPARTPGSAGADT